MDTNGRYSSYLPLLPIRSGAFGVVYSAVDPDTGETVAVKKMRMRQQTTSREIHILSSLMLHPSIIAFREVLYNPSEPEYAYMVMDMAGFDLETRLRSLPAPLEESSARRIMTSLLAGVLHLYHNEVIHRDLKTANVLLNDDGELKICDFGLARRFDDDDFDDNGNLLEEKPFSVPVGTYGYMAPELLLETGEYSPAVDMFSVGCIMAELVGKEPLFPRGSATGEAREILCLDLSLQEKLPKLSPDDLDLLSRLLCYNPRDRITAKGALCHPWFTTTPPPPHHHYNLRSRPHQPCPFRSTTLATR